MSGIRAMAPWRGSVVGLMMLVAAAVMPVRAVAEPAFDPVELSDAYQLEALFEIVAQEGRDDAADIGAEVAGPEGRAGWERTMARLYDPARLLEVFLSELEQEFPRQPEAFDAAIAFARTTPGAQMVQLEIDARAAMLDADIEQMARERLGEARAADARTLAFVDARIEANDLIEGNVSLGLNSALAYFVGFAQTAPDALQPEAGRMMADVWQQEGAIRAEITDWLRAYFLLAYAPLDDDARAAVLDHAASPEGVAFNTAMFNAFDRLFSGLSRALGAEVGRALAASDL
ncbi:MAG: hypothetical protein JJU42_06225 [Rhodobacteraceae bacterium]|nr:hypothetical protein [Paracoccaceae bacterium]